MVIMGFGYFVLEWMRVAFPAVVKRTNLTFPFDPV